MRKGGATQNDLIFLLFQQANSRRQCMGAPVGLFQVKPSDGQHIGILVVKCPLRLRCELQQTTLSLVKYGKKRVSMTQFLLFSKDRELVCVLMES